jgi:hypothetical protein
MSMKGYLTPIPEVATALVEVMESNANKLFDVITTPTSVSCFRISGRGRRHSDPLEMNCSLSIVYRHWETMIIPRMTSWEKFLEETICRG